MIITEDIAKTILAGCYKFGAATLLREGGATMTKVIEVYEEEILRGVTERYATVYQQLWEWGGAISELSESESCDSTY